MNPNPEKNKSAGSGKTILASAVGIILLVSLPALPFLFPLSGTAGPDGIAAPGRFHILTLHFPIALVLMVPLFELLGSIRAFQQLRPSVLPLLFFAALSSVAASVLGFLLALGDGFSGRLIEQHMWGGIFTSILLLITLPLKLLCERTSKKTVFHACYFLSLAGSILSLTSTSHHGASLVHGPTYLTERLPPALQRIFQETEQLPDGISLESNAYESLIKPIFQSRCYSCHSAEKIKGDFRMDDVELLMAGGESGMEGIVPGNLEDSEVHYRIIQKPTSKGLMPPSTELPLAPDQITLIAWWIQNGAETDRSIGDLLSAPDSEKVISIIKNMLSSAPAN
ncbi:hypothetical protein P4B35_14915 [Pontiellaceae bacterium B12227]|nr:hypothetical protein [Pontiellaceae bacterium B12227]